MHGDAVSSSQFSEQGHRDRVGFHRAPGLTDIGDVIDVHPKAGHAESSGKGSILFSAGADTAEESTAQQRL